MKKKKVTLSIESKTYDDFKKYCDSNAIMLSKKIELFMKDVLNDKKLKIVMFLFMGIFMMQFASAVTIFSDGFEDGDISDWLPSGSINQWHPHLSGTPSGSTNPISFDGSYSLLANGTSTIEEFVRKQVNTEGYRNINFSFYALTQGLDPADWFAVYFLNGTTWVELMRIDDINSYTLYSFNLSSYSSYVENNESLIVRFGCSSLNAIEWCSIDNVSITGDLIPIPDTTPPTVNLLDPSNGTTSKEDTVYFSADFTDDVNVTNATLLIWNSTGLVGSNFTVLGNSSISANLSFAFPREDTYHWNYLAYDSSGNSAFSSNNFTITYDDGFLYFDDFEDANLNEWTVVINGTSGIHPWTAHTFGFAYEGLYHAHGFPDSLAEPATSMNITISTFNYSSIQVSYYRWINVTTAGEFKALWFDGSNWNILEETGDNAVDDGSHIFRNFSLPSFASNNLNFQLKFECTALNNNFCTFDNLGVAGTQGVIPDTIFPNIQIEYPQNISYNSIITELNYTVSDDIALDSCWYSLDNGANNASIICGNNVTGILSNEGSNTWTVWANDTSGNENSSSVIFFVDSSAPVFSNFNENPSNGSSYLQGADYEFNITITEDNIDSAGIEFDGVNYSVNNIGDIYTFSINDLSTGDYSYYWWANDTLGNYNVSGTRVYSISQADPNVELRLNGLQSDLELTYGNPVNASVSSSIPGFTLFRDSVDITGENSQNIILGAGYYNYTAYLDGNENYTSSSETWFVNITKSISSCSIFSNSPVNYPNPVNVTANCDNPEAAAELFREGVNVNSENGQEIILGAGSYTYLVNVSESQNYTSAEDSINVVVNKGAAELAFLLNGSSNDLDLVYGEFVNASVSSSTNDLKILRNGIDVTSENNENIILGANYYNYTATSIENENYSSSSISRFVNITKAQSEIDLFLNGTEGNITLTQGESIYLNSTLTAGEGIIELYLDGNLINSGNPLSNLTQFDNIGTFNITALYPETQNYTSSSETWFVEVTVAPDVSNPSVFDLIPTQGAIYEINDTIEIAANISDDTSIDEALININLPNGSTESLTLNNAGNNKYNVSYKITSLGQYNISYFANDTSGNINNSEMTLFNSVDTIAPFIEIISPLNSTYFTNTIIVNISTSDNVGIDSIWFFNGTDNVTYTNEINHAFANGSHELIAYTNDTSGNVNSTRVVFSIDTFSNSDPSVALNSPENGSVTGIDNVLLNATVFDNDSDNLTAWIYGNDQLLNVFENITSGTKITYNWTSLANGDYNWSVIVSDGIVNTTEYGLFSVNVPGTAPIIDIIYPSIYSTYGNLTIPLNFSVTSDELDSCWYKLDNGNDVIINNCSNTSLTVLTNGEYELIVYANESIQGLEGSDNVTFFVLEDKPTIHLLNPSHNHYSNSSEMNFTYIPTFNNLDSCNLYGDFNGNYSLVQNDTSINSGEENGFTLTNLTEGNYNWAIECISGDNSSITGNRSLIVDVTAPNVSLANNVPTVTSSNINFQYSISDLSPTTCTFYVNATSSGNIIFNNITQQCNNIVLNFDVPIASAGNYESVLEAEDEAGNIERHEYTINVITSSDNPGGGSPTVIEHITALNISDVQDLELRRGQSDIFSLDVINSGNVFLNSCRTRVIGDMANWISNRQTESLSPGERAEYFFNINVPLNADPGIHSSDIVIDCDEYSAMARLNVEVVTGDFEMFVLSSRRAGTNLVTSYTLEEFSGRDQEITIDYSFINPDNITTYSGQEVVQLPAGEMIERDLEFELPKDSIGNFRLVLEVSNGLKESVIEQRVFLSNTGITGLAISDENARTLSWFAGFVFVLVMGYLVMKFLTSYHRRNSLSPGREFIKMDLKPRHDDNSVLVSLSKDRAKFRQGYL